MPFIQVVEQHKGQEVNLPATSEVVVVIAFIVLSAPKQVSVEMFIELGSMP